MHKASLMKLRATYGRIMKFHQVGACNVTSVQWNNFIFQTYGKYIYSFILTFTACMTKQFSFVHHEVRILLDYLPDLRLNFRQADELISQTHGTLEAGIFRLSQVCNAESFINFSSLYCCYQNKIIGK